MYPDDHLLRRALLTNAAVSGVCAFALVLLNGPSSRLLGDVPRLTLLVIGLALAVFSADLIRQSRSARINALRAMGVTLADVGWVAGSVALAFARPDLLSPTGWRLFGFVGGVVAACAVGQLIGLYRYARNRRGVTAGRSMYALKATVGAKPEHVWSVLAELDAIDRYAADLVDVQLRGDGGSLTRTCRNRRNQEWTERVLELDDDTHRLVLGFLTEQPNFPYPVTLMAGGWEVDAAPVGAEVTIWFEFTFKWGLWGEILAAVVAPALDKQFTATMERIEAEAVRRMRLDSVSV